VTPASISEHSDLAIEQDARETGVAGDLKEREVMALEGGVSPAFARVFAALQVVRPVSMDERQWYQAINDIGVFLDTWGSAAERLGWTARDVIGPQCSPEALAWALNGAKVTSLTRTSALVSDGRMFVRDTKRE
jgi:hypothetical protein